MADIKVDYEFYTGDYKGTVMPSSAFDRKSVNAEAFVNYITFGRIHKYDLRPEDLTAVKMAICAVAEVQFIADKHKDIKSENNDGYSVTFVNTSDSAVRSRAASAADMYLCETTLRCRAVDYDYECRYNHL